MCFSEGSNTNQFQFCTELYSRIKILIPDWVWKLHWLFAHRNEGTILCGLWKSQHLFSGPGYFSDDSDKANNHGLETASLCCKTAACYHPTQKTKGICRLSNLTESLEGTYFRDLPLPMVSILPWISKRGQQYMDLLWSSFLFEHLYPAICAISTEMSTPIRAARNHFHYRNASVIGTRFQSWSKWILRKEVRHEVKKVLREAV